MNNDDNKRKPWEAGEWLMLITIVGILGLVALERILNHLS